MLNLACMMLASAWSWYMVNSDRSMDLAVRTRSLKDACACPGASNVIQLRRGGSGIGPTKSHYCLEPGEC